MLPSPQHAAVNELFFVVLYKRQAFAEQFNFFVKH